MHEPATPPVASPRGASNVAISAGAGSASTQAQSAKLALEGVTYAVATVSGVRAIVADVSFSIGAGEVFTILGPSGSGKSTLIRTIDRLVEPTGGRVLLDGRPTAGLPVQELRRRVGMVFQAPALFEGTVLDNIAFGPRLRGARGEGGRS